MNTGLAGWVQATDTEARGELGLPQETAGRDSRPAAEGVGPHSSTLAASRSSHCSSSRTAISFLRPRRITRSSGATCSAKKSGDTPSDSAASVTVSASRSGACRGGVTDADAVSATSPPRPRPAHCVYRDGSGRGGRSRIRPGLGRSRDAVGRGGRSHDSSCVRYGLSDLSGLDFRGPSPSAR
jgi:hypothetical protein